MSTSSQPIADNDAALMQLRRAIELSEGEYSLILARCNYKTLRQQIAQKLRSQCSLELKDIHLNPSTIIFSGKVNK